MQHILEHWRRNVIFFSQQEQIGSSAWRWLLVIFLLSGVILPDVVGDFWRQALVAVVFEVLVFLVVVLAAFQGVERALKVDARRWLASHAAWQVPVAAFLGLLPGCAGALLVVAAYLQGGVRVSAVLATAIATMGDAAFLLLAQEPATGVLTMAISGVLGLLVGGLYQLVEKKDFSLPKPVTDCFCSKKQALAGAGLWLGLFLLTLPVALAKLITPSWFAALPFAFLLLWAWLLLTLTAWLWLKSSSLPAGSCGLSMPVPSAIAQQASAMAVWVLVAYLSLALLTPWIGEDFFHQQGFFSPLWAALLGFAPGCGVQVLVTSLYLEGALPYAAQLANAISNSGEALLPLLLAAPRLFWRVSFITFFSGIALAYLPWWW
jgi:hypothetical protein